MGTTCNKCGKELFFKQNPQTEKWLPYSAIGGKLHFEDCPERDPRENIVICVEHNSVEGNRGFFDNWGAWMRHKEEFPDHHYKRWNRRECLG